jgi:hypothetical protein
MSMQMHQKTLAAGQARFAALLSGASSIDTEENYIDLEGYVEDELPEAEYDILPMYIQMLDKADSQSMIDSARDWIKPKVAEAAAQESTTTEGIKETLKTLTAGARKRVDSTAAH